MNTASCHLPRAEDQRIDEALQSVQAGKRLEMTGLFGSSAALILSQWIHRSRGTVVLVAPGEQEALALKEDLEFFLEKAVALYPAAGGEPTSEREKRAVLSERLAILSSLGSDAPPSCVVTAVSGLLLPVPRKSKILSHALQIDRGRELDRAALEETLRARGYQAAPLVTAPGEFSIRGDIVDLFPMAFEQPIRIELFDNEVESIREIEVESQLSLNQREQLIMMLPRIDSDDWKAFFGSHLPTESTLAVLDPTEARNRLAFHARALGYPEQEQTVRTWMKRTPGLDLFPVWTGHEGALEFQVLPARGRGRMLHDIAPSVEYLLKQCDNLQILCQTEAEATRLIEVLHEQGIKPSKALKIVLGRLEEGFQMVEWRQAFINHHELLMRLPVRRERKPRLIKARTLESFADLTEGDLVVHRIHGIAEFMGIKRMEREGGQEDFLQLRFDNDTMLYVPASKVYLVEKYIGGGGAAPKLDRLGGKGFSRRKDRVKEALRDLAADLLELQAAREEEQGLAFGPDDELQALFEASFPYQDTVDQQRAMTEIKYDMERKKPMDRLLCGDVGFGKTELAVRAAFKAVSGGTQVAVLVPTTILAQQHYETFRTRLANYPVTVEVLSRFRTRAQQQAVIEAARENRVDIVIGTHRLLSRDVGFKQLGLLIIDEEQRFGVTHKERLKRLKRTVDVLTMTATPIPRTLHMAMVGLRDISNLEIPPQGRMSIETQVAYKSDELLKKAVLAEINRGGQVFYLHNRVETIERETERIRRLAPGAGVAYAHGQMAERELERVMMRFIRGNLDVLVCTTIIESGIDLPGVNTIVIDRSDRFGLADLHQLRGRVGRGNVRARAYLLVPRKPLPQVALRRLKAIEELSRLGAGFQIALKDLEIRGAGNLLGAEQHGHIAAVGYELFCRLLRETILVMKGKPQEDAVEEVDLELKINAFLPASYIPDEGLRMEFLRKLGRRQDPDGVAAIRAELRDRFGRLPQTVENFLDCCLVRSLLARHGVRRVTVARDRPYLVVDLFDPARYEHELPFKAKEIRFIEPGKAHLHPPKDVLSRGAEGLLKFLKSRLMAAWKTR